MSEHASTATTWRERFIDWLYVKPDPGVHVAFVICVVLSLFTSLWVMAAWFVTALGAAFDHGWRRGGNGSKRDAR